MMANMRSSQILVATMTVMLLIIFMLSKVTFDLATTMSQVLSQIQPLEYLAIVAALNSLLGSMWPRHVTDHCFLRRTLNVREGERLSFLTLRDLAAHRQPEFR